MNNQEKEYFEKLIKTKEEEWKIFQKPNYINIWNSVVDKYSESAHCLYELIQNADDAEAKEIKFILEKDHLIFVHNGIKHFTISNPDNEVEDAKCGKLGHINSITSAGFSTKQNPNANKIGKFGVGFKAVFSYTNTVYIEDDKFSFRIENYIVPKMNDRINISYERKNGETLFVIPFNRTDKKNIEEIYDEIKEKLINLKYPLLFLNNVEEINYTIESIYKKYSKITKAKETVLIKDKDNNASQIIFENLICNNNDNNDNILLFSSIFDNMKYSIGFFLDSESGKLKSQEETVFCFFPVIKETTGLKCIIHAPFELTDSRETIKDIDFASKHNKNLINLLSILFQKALLYLRDIKLIDRDIYNIIPLKEDSVKYNFRIFYHKIKELFSSEEIIPTKSGLYASSKNIYWMYDNFDNVFDTNMLKELYSDRSVEWLDYEKTYKNAEDNLKKFIEEVIGKTHIIDDNDLLNLINSNFIENRNNNIEWFEEFYKWIVRSKERLERVENKLARNGDIPLFVNQNNKAVSLNKSGNNNIFLPSKIINDQIYNYVNKVFLENENIKKYIIEDFKVKEPSRIDYINTFISPKYKDKKNITEDSMDDFLTLFHYFNEIKNDWIKKIEFIKSIKNLYFISYHYLDGKQYLEKPSNLYFPSEDLKEWFKVMSNILFIDYEEYLNKLNNQNSSDELKYFLKELGVKTQIDILTKEDLEKHNITTKCYLKEILKDNYNMFYNKLCGEATWVLYEECFVNGLKENIKVIIKEQNKLLSKRVWNTLCGLIIKNDSNSFLKANKYTQNSKQRKYWSQGEVDSIQLELLRASKWIYNKNNEFIEPENITIDDLSNDYDVEQIGAAELIKKLKFKDKIVLTVEQKLKKLLKENNMSEEEALQIIQESIDKKTKDNDTQNNLSENNTRATGESNGNDAINFNSNTEDMEPSFEQRTKKPSKTTKEIIEQEEKFETIEENDNNIENILDFDDYSPKIIKLDKQIKKLRERIERENDRLNKQSELYEKLNNYDKYSYGWCKILLELELLADSEKQTGYKDITIIFSKIERQEDSKRNFILKLPDKFIPNYIDEQKDIELKMFFSNGKNDEKESKTEIECASVKNYTLEIKLKSDLSDKINLNDIERLTIRIQKPTFLLEELNNRFSTLDLDDNYNMAENLCDDISFIFGPPGTGKTTYLANEEILPLIKTNQQLKILVLTPTNKSADVLTNRIITKCEKNNDLTYRDWLVRFGSTTDRKVEQVYKTNDFDINILKQAVIITTIHRFIYDYFFVNHKKCFLYDFDYDYIIIDEASMISLPYILYPLYRQKQPKKFIIAGDPFQIEPIVNVEEWKDENIYKMIQLETFKENPITINNKYDDKIKLLTTQYRSIPSIGNLFSNFKYNGILKHNREENSSIKLNLGDKFKMKALNILKFPVSKYESIYKVKYLNYSSPYQIYSALFVFEFISWLSELIEENNNNFNLKIGIICPYRAQANIINKLVNSKDFPKNIEILVGTVHSFQGDECDIIFTVFNTPSGINNGCFLNKDTIINVAISRARDYLFIVMPNDEMENIHNLKKIKQIENLITNTDNYTIYSSNDIEKIIFNDKFNYIEDNSFVTGHQDVNLYNDRLIKKYEIRTDDNAVDIQTNIINKQ